MSSFRLRLFLTVLATGAISMAVLFFTAVYVCRENSVDSRIDGVTAYFDKLSNKMISNVYLKNPSLAPEISTELKLAASMMDGRVIVADNRLKVVFDSYSMEEGRTIISPDAIKTLRGGTTTLVNYEKEYAQLSLPIVDMETGDGMPYVGAMFIKLSIHDSILLIADMEKYLIFAMVLLSFILIIICILSSYEFAKPFKEINQSIHHVSEGYIDDKVVIGGYSELVKVSDSFNEMLDKISKIEESRQSFVSNVSHELKTPITSIKVLADSLLMQPDSPPEVYREFLNDINAEIDRENKIITDLLDLVKLDRKEGDMHVEAVSINELLELIMKRISPIANAEAIELVFESYRDVIAEVDEVKLSLAFTNLIENAVKYNRENGRVQVSLNSDHKAFIVTVKDTGIGIPQQSLDKIFDRFYRVDKTRARETGGTGLGLAITRSVVLMHNGTIRVESVESEGSTFTVRIPMNYVSGKTQGAE